MSRTFKHYQLERVLGKGGMAEVHLALDTKTNRHVALKLIHERISKDAHFKKRFLHEFEAHSKMVHPNIVEVFDGPEHDGNLYMAMEVIEGWTLQEFYQEHGEVPPPIAAYLVREVLKGLMYTHEQGTVHRDIKPANVMLSRKTGEVKIADFGIVKDEQQTMLTQAGEIIGTPAYMSPEQAMGKKIDFRTDIYACGVMMYELISGESPFMDSNIGNVIMKVIKGNFKPLFEIFPEVSDDIARISAKMMARDSGARYNSCKEAIDDLDPVLKDFGPLATQETFRKYISDPDKYYDRFRNHLGELHYKRAELLVRQPKRAGDTLLELRRAVLFNPDLDVAKNMLLSMGRRLRQNVAKPTQSPLLESLESAHEKDRLNPEHLTSLAKEHIKLNNFFQSVDCLRKLLLLQNGNTYALMQLRTLEVNLGPDGYEKPRKDQSATEATVVTPPSPGSASSGKIKTRAAKTDARAGESKPRGFKELAKGSAPAGSNVAKELLSRSGGNLDISQFQNAAREASGISTPPVDLHHPPASEKTGTSTGQSVSLPIAAIIAVVLGAGGFLGGMFLSGTPEPAPVQQVSAHAIDVSPFLEMADELSSDNREEVAMRLLEAVANQGPAEKDRQRVFEKLASILELSQNNEQALQRWRKIAQSLPAGNPAREKAIEKVKELSR